MRYNYELYSNSKIYIEISNTFLSLTISKNTFELPIKKNCANKTLSEKIRIEKCSRFDLDQQIKTLQL